MGIQKLSSSRRFPASAVRRLLFTVGALLLAAGAAAPAGAQCTLQSGPTALQCTGCSGNLGLNAGPHLPGVYQSSPGVYRLMVKLNYGHAVYSLADPANPVVVGIDDLRSDSPGPGPFPGDGQTYISNAEVAKDGAFALFSLDVTGKGGTVIGRPNTLGLFKPAGDTGVYRANGGLVIQKNGSRYIGYGLGGGPYLFAADITSAVNYSVGSITSEQAAFQSLLDSAAGNLQLAEGNGFQYLYLTDKQSIVIADASSPGLAGNITTAYPTWTIPGSAWNLPSGDTLAFAQAAVDPKSPAGNLVIAGVFRTSSGSPVFALLSWNRTTGQATPAGTFTPDPAFTVTQVSGGVVAAANSYTSDVDVYMWAQSPTGGAYSNGVLRLYATSAGSFGSAIGQTVDIDIPPVPQSGFDTALRKVVDTKILRTSDSDVYAYLSGGTVPWAMHMNCTNGPAPAAGHLAVSNVSAGGAQITSGATVFVGDTLQIAPSVSPSNLVQPVLAWDLDFDYHSGPETGAIGLLQLQNPDSCFGTACPDVHPSSPDPPQFTLIGPCDPRSPWNGTPSTGVGCWTSVAGPTGNGDFSTSTLFPAPGSYATLPIAFEAENALNTTTVPLATFNVKWTVPAVKLQNLSALLDSTFNATFQSASEGHPVSYNWYFGSASNALTPASCTGSSCTYPFAANGTYYAWLVASYNGGYSSPDWSPSPTDCYGGPCAIQVNVTDFVPAFTADSIAYIGGNGIHVSNQSNSPAWRSSANYLYYLCLTTSGSCSDNLSGYSQLQPAGIGPWTIPTPATAGTYWLRIKATYGIGPSTAQWQPNVTGVSDPYAWPITVSAVPPSLYPISGATSCTVGCSGVVYLGTVGTQITVAAYQGTTQLTGSYSWQTSGASASPSSGTGSTFTFSPSAGNLTVTNSDFAISLSFIISNPAPPPPNNPSVTVSANPSSTTVGTNVSLSASASGGTAPYTSYYWTFGDGSAPLSGPYPSPTHAFQAAGTFYPSCTVTDHANNQGSGSTTVTVTAGSGSGPSATSVLPLSGTTPCTVGCSGVQYLGNIGVAITVGLFNVSTQLSGSFGWQITSGSASPTSGTGTTFTFTPTAGGALVVTNTDTGLSLSIQISGVAVQPDFRIAYPDGTNAVLGSDGSFLVVAGQQNMFRAVSAANPSQTLSLASPYWNWGDGTAGPSVTPVAKTWILGGTYPVTLAVTGQPTALHNVNVVGGIPTAAYSFAYSVNGQAGGPVNANNVAPGAGILFTATGPPGAEYDWDFGDGTPVAPGSSVTSHVFAAAGSYPVVLTVKLGGNTFQTQQPTTFYVVEPPRWIVSGLAYTSGLVPGSSYVSDVVIQNPSATGWAAYSVALLDGSDPPNWISLSAFQPLESRRIPNILGNKSVFGKAKGGPTFAMVVRGDTVPADPAIWAFTYNNNASDPTKGTYGVAIPAVPVSMAVGPGSPAASREIPGLRDIPQTDPPGTSAAYTNIGFVNAGSVPATVNVSFFSRDGTSLSGVGNPFPLVVGPNQTLQQTQSLRQALAGTGQSYDTYTADDYYMSVDVVGDGAKVVPYATVKDVASTDSIFLTSAPAVPGPFRIPSVVRVNSTTGDVFRSRVVVFNPSAQDRAVRLTYSYIRCPAGQDCDDRAYQSITLGTGGVAPLPSGGTLLADDFVQTLFGALGIAVSDTDSYIQSYLDVAPADDNTDPLIVRGETYNAQPNGNFGTEVPGLLPAVNGASPGTARTRLTIPYVVPKSGGSGYRTNVALVALGDTSAQATIILHAPFLNSGFPGDLSQTSVVVDDKLIQLSLEKLFPALANFPPIASGYYSLEIQVTSGTLAAYAVINDNITSDGSLILAQPLP